MNGEKSRRSFLRNTAIAGGAAAAGLSGITSARAQKKTPAALEKIMKTKNDLELLGWINNNLNTCVVCDSLDDLGIPVRAMDGRIRPLHPDFAFVGRARTVLWRDLYEPVKDDPYGKEIDSADALRPGDVSIHSTDYAMRNAPWGDLMSTASKMRGAHGAIIDSNTRDVKNILKLGFPVFTAGIKPLNSMGRGIVVDYDCVIECGGVKVKPGELVVADFDGIVVVPKEGEKEALILAEQKITAEGHTRRELFKGRLLREVYEEYGVL